MATFLLPSMEERERTLVSSSSYKDTNPICEYLTGSDGKESAWQCRICKRRRFDPWVRKIPWRRKWQPTIVFLPGEYHGQRSLAGYSPWDHKESDMTELLTPLWSHLNPIISQRFHLQIPSPWGLKLLDFDETHFVHRRDINCCDLCQTCCFFQWVGEESYLISLPFGNLGK